MLNSQFRCWIVLWILKFWMNYYDLLNESELVRLYLLWRKRWILFHSSESRFVVHRAQSIVRKYIVWNLLVTEIVALINISNVSLMNVNLLFFVPMHFTTFHVYSLSTCLRRLVSLSYFNRTVPMLKCSGEHSCMSPILSKAILNDTCIFDLRK